ncbi:MAG: hypothetical protein IJU23_10080 [Proteobacteria bacterium]|nr:hypothetical protein [Pseudomonadota bacterium]
MQESVKKLAVMMASSVLLVPSVVWAQSEPEGAESAPAVAEATPDNSSEASQPSEKSESVSASADNSESGEQANPSISEKANAPSEESAAAPSGESNTSLPEAIASKKTSQEARKAAMKNLANSYPADGSGVSAAQTTKPSDNQAITPVVISPAVKTSERMPRFEHHGYFRTRLNAFGNYDLNTRGTSPVASPLDSEQRGNSQQENIDMSDTDTHLGGNLRFRYSPTIHITESVRVAGSFDIMDNFVLGTSPNGLRTNWGSHEFFSFNGAEPVNGDTFGKNVIGVKALYGEADTIIGTFRAGRIPTHWGMGIVYNDGGVYKREQQIIEGSGWKCLDCESSDAVDKVEYRIREPFADILYFSFSWDFVNSGLASYNLQQDSIGQSFDLSDNDDVLQFTLSLFDRPISQQEIDERYRALYETRHWVADWGVLFSYRKQEIAPEEDAIKSGDGMSATYDLYRKDAKAYIVDAWGRFYIPCPKEVMLRLEAEFVGAFGSVKLDTGNEGVSRDITQIGFAFEGEVWWRDLITGLKFGTAWADNMVYSGHPLIEKLDAVPMGSIMRFDPNYTVDQIMFRELMGGINNAWYLNIYGEYKFPIVMPQMTMSLGARLDLTTSGPLVKEATPGNSSWYGFEGNVKLFYDESDRFRFEIGAGLFVPGDAWERKVKSDYPILPSQSVYEDATSNDYDPEIAWNVIANLYFMF